MKGPLPLITVPNVLKILIQIPKGAMGVSLVALVLILQLALLLVNVKASIACIKNQSGLVGASQVMSFMMSQGKCRMKILSISANQSFITGVAKTKYAVLMGYVEKWTIVKGNVLALEIDWKA